MNTHSVVSWELELGVDNEHDHGHDHTQGTYHEVGDAQEIVLSTHPGHVAEHHLLPPIKTQNRIV